MGFGKGFLNENDRLRSRPDQSGGAVGLPYSHHHGIRLFRLFGTGKAILRRRLCQPLQLPIEGNGRSIPDGIRMETDDRASQQSAANVSPLWSFDDELDGPSREKPMRSLD